jgi:hypothetical protein
MRLSFSIILFYGLLWSYLRYKSYVKGSTYHKLLTIWKTRISVYILCIKWVSLSLVCCVTDWKSYLRLKNNNILNIKFCLNPTGWTAEGSEFESPWGARFVSSLRRPCRFWDPPNLISSGYRRQSDRAVKLTAHLQLVPRTRMRGSVHLLPPYVFMA